MIKIGGLPAASRLSLMANAFMYCAALRPLALAIRFAALALLAAPNHEGIGR